jgi:hypothetical protein
MKRFPATITICCITFGLLTSGIVDKGLEIYSRKSFSVQQLHDTTGIVGLLRVDSFNLEIISPSSGIQFYKDGIVFLSNTKNEGKMLPKHVSFGTAEAYTAIVKDTSLGFHMLFSPASSFSYPCEAMTFSNDFKTMFYTKIARKETKERIYRAELKSDGKCNSIWITDVKPLDFCIGDYRYTHPALSADSKMMIFASDMSGSVGGMDLFITRKDGEKWSKPENLGKSINTSLYECFPYLDPDNNLFFSSDGLAGLGGYDIYTCKFNGETWEKPMNLSHRINSEIDDIAFSINKTDGKSAFYTKKQKSGKGEMQLLRVILKQDLADNNPSSISSIYNGKPVSETALLATKAVEQTTPPAKEPPSTVQPETKKETKVEEVKAAANPISTPPSAKTVIIKPTSPIPEELKDVVIYRIQFLSTTKPRKETQIVINGVAYKTYEYFYLNSYRYSVGEFKTLAPAKELQSICRKSGYPQAFIAAFKNNLRSIDLTVFK